MLSDSSSAPHPGAITPRPTRRASPLEQLLPVLFAAAAAIIPIAASSLYGVGIESDGVSYLSTARSLVEHHAFRDFQGPYVDWGPLFPCLIAMGHLLGLDYPASALA